MKPLQERWKQEDAEQTLLASRVADVLSLLTLKPSAQATA